MAAATKEPKKVKKGFKMPHLFWIMICLLFVSSLLTYVIPAGQFMTDPETGKILGDQFQYLGAQTPVSPLQVLLLLIVDIHLPHDLYNTPQVLQLLSLLYLIHRLIDVPLFLPFLNVQVLLYQYQSVSLLPLYMASYIAVKDNA